MNVPNEGIRKPLKQPMNRWLMAGVLGGLSLAGFPQAAGALDLSDARVPLEEILDGGPPKDGIPALTDPKVVPAEQANDLGPADRILGLAMNGQARAYPIKILNWHEVVNDRLGGQPVLVSYCPLCGSGMAFDARGGGSGAASDSRSHARVRGERLLFGVSGKLYNSDVLFYDRKTESLWSQLKMEAVTGRMAGTRLVLLPLENTTWEDWRKRYPATTVLSSETGYARDYALDPYSDYENEPSLMFPVVYRDPRLPAKEWVIGVSVEGRSKAYPFSVLAKSKQPIHDRIGELKLIVEYNPTSRSARIADASGRTVPAVTAYWFAWAAFHPETEVFGSTERAE